MFRSFSKWDAGIHQATFYNSVAAVTVLQGTVVMGKGLGQTKRESSRDWIGLNRKKKPLETQFSSLYSELVHWFYWKCFSSVFTFLLNGAEFSYLVSTIVDVYKHVPSMQETGKKCRSCKNKIFRSYISLQLGGGIRAELPPSYENNQCLFSNLEKETCPP